MGVGWGGGGGELFFNSKDLRGTDGVREKGIIFGQLQISENCPSLISPMVSVEVKQHDKRLSKMRC